MCLSLCVSEFLFLPVSFARSRTHSAINVSAFISRSHFSFSPMLFVLECSASAMSVLAYFARGLHVAASGNVANAAANTERNTPPPLGGWWLRFSGARFQSHQLPREMSPLTSRGPKATTTSPSQRCCACALGMQRDQSPSPMRAVPRFSGESPEELIFFAKFLHFF